MKNLVLAAAAATTLSGTANAQVEFQFGSLEFEYIFVDFFGDIYPFRVSGQGDYDIGNFGLQLDSSIFVITDFGTSFNTYSVGAHVYKEFGNGTKIGAFGGVDFIEFSGLDDGLYSVGVEGITSFGNLDIEASLARLFVTGDAILWIAELDIYYQISNAIELTAGANIYFDDDFIETFYIVGASYNLPNMPVTISANYNFNGIGFDTVGVSAAYAFGGPADERLFQNREFNFLLIP